MAAVFLAATLGVAGAACSDDDDEPGDVPSDDTGLPVDTLVPGTDVAGTEAP